MDPHTPDDATDHTTRHTNRSAPRAIARKLVRLRPVSRITRTLALAIALAGTTGALTQASSAHAAYSQPGFDAGGFKQTDAKRVTIATQVATSAALTEPQTVEFRRDAFEVDRSNLAISGYDPVAYFPIGGSKATKGKKKISHEHNGLTYRFATEANRTLFIESPETYEPAYGGWCAYAISHEGYTEPNPKRFTIQNGRLLLFYDGLFGNTFKAWQDEGAQKLEPIADTFWRTELTEKAQKLVG
jgi:YHS domain-containing protein